MLSTIKRISLFVCLISGLFSIQYPQSKDQIAIGNGPVKPFRIAGNLYYVGTTDVTSYLITTPKGHILIDSGLTETVPQIKSNVATLGFRLEDIKILLNSHAHFDHAGGLAELRRMTNGQFYASEKDAGLLMRGGLDDPNYGDKYPFEPVKPDKLFRNGEKVKLGGTTLTANITAGHTMGCTTWTTTIKDHGRVFNVLFLCSVSSPSYDLVTNKKYPNIEADYRASFSWLKKAKVDIFLASHAGVFGLIDKADELRKGKMPNPFVDPQGYKDFVVDSERVFLEKLKAQKAANK